MISVCMSVYNGERYILRQVDSILKQLDLDDEVIVYDDHSTDNTLSILVSIGDQRIKIIRSEKNNGFLYGFQCAIDAAKGEYVFLSDQDDIWLPSKVQVVMEYFDKGADCIIHDAIVMDDVGKIINHSLFNIVGSTNKSYKNFLKNTATGACMAFRANIISKFMPIPANAIYHDRWIVIILALKLCRVFTIPEKLIYYVRHEKNVTCLKRNSILHVVKDRLLLFMAIMKYLFKAL